MSSEAITETGRGFLETCVLMNPIKIITTCKKKRMHYALLYDVGDEDIVIEGLSESTALLLSYSNFRRRRNHKYLQPAEC